MDIVMTGFAGLSGSRKLWQDRRAFLSAKLPEWLYDSLCALPDGSEGLQPEDDARILCRVPVGDGGVWAALWELGEAAVREVPGCSGGLTVTQADIPIRQETIEICEMLEEDPCRLASGGWLFLAEEGWLLDGAVIGHLTEGRARVILGREGIRYLERPRRRTEERE